MAGNVFPCFGVSSKCFNKSKSTAPNLSNKRLITKDIYENTLKTLKFLSNIIEMKYKSKKLPENRRSPEAIQVQSDMSHMRESNDSRFNSRFVLMLYIQITMRIIKCIYRIDSYHSRCL